MIGNKTEQQSSGPTLATDFIKVGSTVVSQEKGPPSVKEDTSSASVMECVMTLA